MAYNTVVFDLDGTLLETLEDLMDSVNYILSKEKLPLQNLAQIKQHVGNGVRRLVELSVPGGENCPGFESIFSEFKKHYALNCCNKTRPYDGITDVLEELKKRGIKTAVITNKFQSAAEETCKRYFPNLITKVLGETDGIPRKPAPDIVYKALNLLNSEIEDSVMFGDSETDIKTAKNAGINYSAVLWGFRTKEQLLSVGAERFISDTKEILDIVFN